MRTNEIRKLVLEELDRIKESTGVKSVYFEDAPDDAMYPHVIFSFSGTNLDDMNRKDFTIDVDVYTKDNPERYDIVDMIEDAFVFKNAPQEDILPTFYLLSRVDVLDQDKSIKHTVIRLECQNYG